MNGLAMQGLAAGVVETIVPHTEADPAGLLVQLLVGFGSCIGRTAHFRVEGDCHFLNLFAVLVGATAGGRKGSSWGQIRRFLAAVDPDWAGSCIKGGLESGQGIIYHVRDERTAQVPVKEKGQITGYQTEVVDEGVKDKRLLCYEPEFSSVLRIDQGRSASTLSTTLRQAWETGNLRSLTKNSPSVATGAHISVIGHCTEADLQQYLTVTERANGFANRFLWVAVERQQYLPMGGDIQAEQWNDLVVNFHLAIEFAQTVGEMGFTADARALWEDQYRFLTDEKPGIAGAVLARAAAQVRRLACLYALLELKSDVDAWHLEAALGLWEHVRYSVQSIFGSSLGDAVSDQILERLMAEPKGLTRTQLRDGFSRHNAALVTSKLNTLKQSGLIVPEKFSTGGRDGERWFPTAKGLALFGCN
jgi:hypothetical protein